MNTIEGDFLANDAKIAIAAARFNGFIVSSLVDGALDALKRHGVDSATVDCAWVPGAFELPLLVKRLAALGRYDGIIALGAVIRGSTPHFDYVAGECAKGVGSVSLQFDLPIAFGVLTVDTIEQAVERSGTKAGNKGIDAAMSVLEMVSLIRKLEAPSP